MIKFIRMRFLRVIKLTKAEKNLPLSPEDYMLTFIPDYLELVGSFEVSGALMEALHLCSNLFQSLCHSLYSRKRLQGVGV